MNQYVIIIALIVLIGWSILGYIWIKKKFDNPFYKETNTEVLLAGPFIWLLSLYIRVYNLFVIK